MHDWTFCSLQKKCTIQFTIKADKKCMNLINYKNMALIYACILFDCPIMKLNEVEQFEH